jgi:hypothetical protein
MFVDYLYVLHIFQELCLLIRVLNADIIPISQIFNLRHRKITALHRHPTSEWQGHDLDQYQHHSLNLSARRALQPGIKNRLEDERGKFFFFFFFLVLGFELRAFTLSYFVKGFFGIGSCKLFAQAGFELRSS